MPFHWCPEETAAVIAAGSAAAFGLVWVKARWFIFVGWLRRKLGLVDKSHCCVEGHGVALPVFNDEFPAPSKAKPTTKQELLDLMDSFEKARAADRVLSVKKVSFDPGQHVIRMLKPTSDGIYPQHGPNFMRRYRNAESEASYTPSCEGAYPLDLPPLDPETK